MRAGWRFALAALVGLACVAPFLLLGLLSIAGPWEFPALWPSHLRFDRWVTVLTTSGELSLSLVLSLFISTLVALVATAGGCVSARAVAGHPYQRPLLLLAYLPFAASPVILGVCLLYVYIRIGLAATIAGVVLAHLTFAYAFAVLFWVPFWNARTRAYEDLVRTLGGTHLQAWRLALLPLLRDPLGLCFLQTFSLSWFQYGLTLLVGAGKVDTLPLRVYAYVGEANLGYAAVAGMVLLLPPLALAWLKRGSIRRLA